MNDDSIFEAGRSIGRIESFYQTALEKSTRFLIRAKEKQFSSIEVILLSNEYGNSKDFMHEIEIYKRGLLSAYQEYHSIKQKFPNLAYFNDGGNTFRLELQYQNALLSIEEATTLLNRKEGSKKT